MVTFGTVRCANFMNFEREDLWRTNIPLADGVLHPSYTGNVTAIDPLNDGVDRPVSWQPFGPLYRSGYCRVVTVTFRVRMDAGVADGVGARATTYPGLLHTYFGGDYSTAGAPREVEITDDANNGETFSFHASTGWPSLNLSKLIIQTDIYLEKHDNASITKHFGMLSNLASGIFAQVWDNGKLNNGVVSFAQPNTIVEQGPQHTLIRTRARCYPELQGANKTDWNSFVHDCLILFGKDQRFAKVYYFLNSSFITADVAGGSTKRPDPRCTHYRNRMDFSQEKPITVTVTGPRVTGCWGLTNQYAQVDRSYGSIGGSDSVWTNVITIRHRNDPAFGSGRPRDFPYYTGHVVEFTVFFDQDESTVALTSIEESTRKCLEEDASGTGAYGDTGISWLSPISADWKAREEAFGPYGCLLGRPGTDNIPATTLITDDDTAFQGACNLAFVWWNDIDDRSPTHYPLFQMHVNGAQPASYPVFYMKCWPAATTGAPDLRAYVDNIYQYANRPWFAYYENGTTLDAADHREKMERLYGSGTTPTGYQRVTDIVCRKQEPYRSGGAGNSNPWPSASQADLLGKVGGEGPDEARTPNNLPWRGLDPQHWEHDDIVYTALLTANPWMMYVLIPCLANMCLGRNDNVDGRTLSQTSVSSMWFYSAPRQEARIQSAKSTLAWVVQDSTLRARLIDQQVARINALYLAPEPANNHNPANNTQWGVFLNKDLAGISTDGPGSSEQSQCFNGVFRSGWKPWQSFIIGKLSSFINIVEQTEHYDATRGAAAVNLKTILYKFAKAYALYGFRANSETGGWQLPFSFVDWSHDPTTPGKALPAESVNPDPYIRGSCRENVSKINPTTTYPYTTFGKDWEFIWTVSTLLVGYEYALVVGDTSAANAIADRLNGVKGYIALATAVMDEWQGRYFGWPALKPSDFHMENPWEAMMYVRNPLKDRDPLNTSLLPTSTVLASGNVTGGDPIFTGGLAATTVLASMLITGVGLTMDGQGLGGYFELEASSIVAEGLLSDADPILDSPLVVPAATILGAHTITEVGLGSEPAIPSLELETSAVVASLQVTRNILIVTSDNDTRPEYELIATYSPDVYLWVDKMVATNQTFQVPEGDDFVLRVSLSDTLSNLDLSDAENITWKVNRNGVRGDTVISKTLGNGLTVQSPSSFIVEINGEDTVDLSGTHYHQVTLDINDKRYTLLTGVMSIVATSLA